MTANSEWHPRANPWVIAVVVAMAAFMEVLDTSIANVALPHIAGNLGATTDQSTWVLTSYLVSNAIVLPMTGWIAGVIGRRRFFLTCLAIFTASSLLCGVAPSLGSIILFRVLQGAGGGGLQPMAQAILADTFPPRQRGLAFAVFGITAVFAPTIGPTLGGWITDNYSWRWIFLINLPVGILAAALISRVVEDPPWVKRAAGAAVRVDYIGIALLVVGVGALQIMLDKGQQDDWFQSHLILLLAAVAALCLSVFAVWEWFHEHPIVEVHLFRNVNFLSANAMMFVVGIMSFASLVMMPLFLQTLMGYTSESAGLVLSGGGVLLLLLMPVVGTLASRVQARYMIAFGWLALALSMHYSAQQLNLGLSFRAASVLRVAQVVGFPFLFVPINLAAYVGMPADKASSMAGLLNFARNIGSSFGTSMVTTLIARREQFHQVHLSANTSAGDAAFTHSVAALAHRLQLLGLDAASATSQAYARLYRALVGQATALAYVDTFELMACGAGIMFLLSFALRRNQPGGGPVAAH